MRFLRGFGALLLMSAVGAGCDRPEVNGTIDVVGERVGVLVWHPVASVEAYEVEILDGDDKVLHHLTTRDTVAPMPPTLTPRPSHGWVVRALRDGRAVARSERQRLY